MNKLRCIVSIICLFFLVVNTTSAQRNVDRLLNYYELGAYHLTIKKIKKLKEKRQSRTNVQLILADCYWQIGDKKRSVTIYEELAVGNEIPNEFKEKYERAIFEKQRFAKLTLNSKSFEYFEVPATYSEVKGHPVKSFYTPKKTQPKLELSSQQMVLKERLLNTVTIKTPPPISNDIHNIEPTNPMSFVRPVEGKRVNAKRLPAKSLVNSHGAKFTGKYRVRIPVASNEEASTLIEYMGLAEVEIFEWAKRKIVIAGSYDSLEVAQSFIDQYLKHFYSKAVVVTKVEGRYKSVVQVL